MDKERERGREGEGERERGRGRRGGEEERRGEEKRVGVLQLCILLIYLFSTWIGNRVAIHWWSKIEMLLCMDCCTNISLSTTLLFFKIILRYSPLFAFNNIFYIITEVRSDLLYFLILFYLLIFIFVKKIGFLPAGSEKADRLEYIHPFGKDLKKSKFQERGTCFFPPSFLTSAQI
jgi:hypothetical protein